MKYFVSSLQSVDEKCNVSDKMVRASLFGEVYNVSSLDLFLGMPVKIKQKSITNPHFIIYICSLSPNCVHMVVFS